MLNVEWQRNAEQDNALVTRALADLVDTDLHTANVEKNLALINEVCAGGDFAEIVDAILAITSEDKWLSNGVKALVQGSPISARAIYRQLQEGSTLSLAEVFRFELVLATNILRYPEFAEGVRALLIDKDRQPRWRFPTVRVVPDSLMDQLFTPPWANNPLADL